MILTSSNAADALEQVIPEIREIGFMADSVRVPVPTESLIILNVTFQSRIGPDGASVVNRGVLNRIYQEAASGTQKGLLVYSEEQNVPADVRGGRAAVVIEAVETHTRTGFVDVDLTQIPGLDSRSGSGAWPRSRCACPSPTPRSSAGTTTSTAATPTCSAT